MVETAVAGHPPVPVQAIVKQIMMLHPLQVGDLHLQVDQHILRVAQTALQLRQTRQLPPRLPPQP